MGQPQRGPRLHRSQDPRVHTSLRGIRDQADDQIRLADDVKDLPKRPVGLREAHLPRLIVRRRVRAQADHHLGIHTGLSHRIPKVLRLGRSLRAPADDADLLDSLEGLRKHRVLIAPSPANKAPPQCE